MSIILQHMIIILVVQASIDWLLRPMFFGKKEAGCGSCKSGNKGCSVDLLKFAEEVDGGSE